jgi:hypothetical protein
MAARAFAAFLVLAVLTTLSASAAGTLFDASLGSTPDQQGWVLLRDPSSNSAVQTVQSGVTVLDTMADQTDKAGYFATSLDPRIPYRHPLLPNFDRTTGFVIRLDARLVDEVHRLDRAGFGVIAVTDDLKAVELEFWPDELWVQADEPLFTHGEGAKFDTTSATVSYELRIQGDGYQVRANGAEILSGPLKEYSSFGAPYSVPGFFFIGDDTTSAAARVEIARVDVNPL